MIYQGIGGCGDSLMVEPSLFQAKGDGSIPISPLQLILDGVDKKTAKRCYDKWHYLKGKDFLSSFSFGIFYNGRLWGCITFKQPSAQQTVKGLFNTTNQNHIYEIGRFALSDFLPKNSESRVIAMGIKLLKKLDKNLKAIITYADTAMGHKGTIYKAVGFQYKGLTSPKKDFWVNGKIQERGKTKNINGEWKARSQKHLFIKIF